MNRSLVLLVLIPLIFLGCGSSSTTSNQGGCFTNRETVSAIYSAFNKVDVIVDKCDVLNLDGENTLTFYFDVSANYEKKILACFGIGGMVAPKTCSDIKYVAVIFKKDMQYYIIAADILSCNKLANNTISWDYFLNNYVAYKTVNNY